MAHIAVEKVHEPNATPASILDKMQALTESIRKRAYELFQRHGETDRSAMED